MLKRETAKKVQKQFTKMIKKIRKADQNNMVLLNASKAKSFVKALELTEAIDYYTAQKMKSMIFEAEQGAYKM